MSEGVRLAEQVARLVTGSLDRTSSGSRAGAGAPSPTGSDLPRAGCPVCACPSVEERWAPPVVGSDGGVAPEAFRPSTDRFGEPSGTVVRCERCRHGWVAEPPDEERVAAAYEAAEDPVSIDEVDGQVETADRILDHLERLASGRRLLDVGCWTGSFLDAARTRGWETVGMEPSRWAARIAERKGLTVVPGFLGEINPGGMFDAVHFGDVLEHLDDPLGSLIEATRHLSPGGIVSATVPDASSAVARAMGRRWWSVVPMHLHYFTKDSLDELLRSAGLDVVSAMSHPKVFSLAYYGDRVAALTGPAGRVVSGLATRGPFADRLVAPDFGDRRLVFGRLPPVPGSTSGR